MIDFTEKIWILDGAMASMIHQFNIDNHSQFSPNTSYSNLQTCPDSLCVTNPDLIEQIHLEYLNSGADIITSNSFNANPITLSKYGIDISYHDICCHALNIAKSAIKKHSLLSASSKKYIAGCIGPIIKEPKISEQEIANAYTLQSEALIENGADMILLETICSLHQAIIASNAIIKVMNRLNRQLPLMLSFSLSAEGTTYDDNKSIQEIIATTKNLQISSIGINCGCDIIESLNHITQFSNYSDLPISFHPSAGLPDNAGNYNISPQQLNESIQPLLENQQVNIIGGCCGTTPKHIQVLAQTASFFNSRKSINSHINRKLN